MMYMNYIDLHIVHRAELEEKQITHPQEKKMLRINKWYNLNLNSCSEDQKK